MVNSNDIIIANQGPFPFIRFSIPSETSLDATPQHKTTKSDTQDEIATKALCIYARKTPRHRPPSPFAPLQPPDTSLRSLSTLRYCPSLRTSPDKRFVRHPSGKEHGRPGCRTCLAAALSRALSARAASIREFVFQLCFSCNDNVRVMPDRTKFN